MTAVDGRSASAESRYSPSRVVREVLRAGPGLGPGNSDVVGGLSGVHPTRLPHHDAPGLVPRGGGKALPGADGSTIVLAVHIRFDIPADPAYPGRVAAALGSVRLRRYGYIGAALAVAGAIGLVVSQGFGWGERSSPLWTALLVAGLLSMAVRAVGAVRAPAAAPAATPSRAPTTSPMTTS